MPTYDYICSDCNYQLEAFQKINDEPLKTCPKCHKEALKRGIGGGAATFRFVGDGFYINDYKDKSSETCASGGGKCECNKT